MQVWIHSRYEGAIKKLVRGLKYERKKSAVAVLAPLLDDLLPYFHKPPLVSYAPTTTARHRQRGYDHAAMLARELAKIRGWEFAPTLVRLDQSRQVGSSRKERISNKIEYRVCTEVKDRTILLVDDVVTTGSTLELAAKSLRGAGATHVSAAVLASNRS